MSSGRSKYDSLVSTNSRHATGDSEKEKLDLAMFNEDAGVKDQLLISIELSMGNCNTSQVNPEAPGILEMVGGKICMLSPPEFQKKCFEKAACLQNYKLHVTEYWSTMQGLEDAKKRKKDDLQEDYDSATDGYPRPGWPQKKVTPDGAPGKRSAEDEWNDQLSKFFNRSCRALEEEFDAKRLEAMRRYNPYTPINLEEASKVSYDKSAQAVLREFEKRFTPDSLRFLVNKAKAADISYRNDPADKVLESFLDTLNSFDVVHSVAWFERQKEQSQRFLNDEQPRNVQEHARHFDDWMIEEEKKFNRPELDHPAKILAGELRSVPNVPDFAEIKNKYRGMALNTISYKIVREFWEEMQRSPSTMKWARSSTLNDRAPNSTGSHKQAQRPAVGAARTDTGQATEKFKFKCHSCGEFGHPAKDCPNGVRCYNCGQHGHISRDCTHPRRAPSQSARSRPHTPARTRAGRDKPSALITQVNGGNTVGALKPALKQAVAWADQAEEPSVSGETKKTKPSGIMATKPTGTEEQKPAGTKETKQVGKMLALKIATNGALGPNAQKEPMNMKSVKIDTGADVTVCERNLLSDVTEHDAEIVSFNGELCKSTVKGILSVVVADKLDPKVTYTLHFEAWGCDGIGSTPLIAWKNLSAAGAEMHLAQGDGANLNLEKLGGPMLRIHEDGMMDVVRVDSGMDSEGWRTVRRLRSSKRFAPRQQIGARAKNE